MKKLNANYIMCTGLELIFATMLFFALHQGKVFENQTGQKPEKIKTHYVEHPAVDLSMTTSR